MLVLLDENLLSKKLKKPLVDVGHSVQNVENMGWRGVRDQELLALAEAHPFDQENGSQAPSFRTAFPGSLYIS